MNCPCQSQKPYSQCCQPLHQGAAAASAEALMRSRYSAYCLQDIDYIVETTVPSQQSLLNRADLQAWSEQTQWCGLDIWHNAPKVGKQHAQVGFTAYFTADGTRHEHRELSGFVQINGRWYFLDPTVPLPSMNAVCVCGSAKKFKHCCAKVM
ncbi:MAG: YchJ family protein [Neisseria sp.]|nr:YchJ family protein [Neisseria sp.]